MAGRIFEKWKNAVTTMLKSGMGRRQIALCIAMGIVLGIFPVLGVTTLLCAVAALLLRLNLPAMQIVNIMVYPVQLALLTPFYSAGKWLFKRGDNVVDYQNVLLMLKNDFWGSMSGLWDLTLYAIFTWAVICPILVLTLYHLFKPAVTAMVINHNKVE